MVENHVGIIVLAAGASMRMGSPKQLLKIAGVTMIRRAARIALDSNCRPVVVVLGANADLIRPELDGLEVHLAINFEWEKGMSTTIRSGLGALLNLAPNTPGVILMLADQPALTGAALQKLAGAFNENPAALIAARYCGQLGAPALFPRSHFQELTHLQADAGAKGLLKKFRESVVPVDLPEAALDIDTPADVKAWAS